MDSQYSVEYLRALETAEDLIREICAKSTKSWVRMVDPETVIDYLWDTLQGSTEHNISLVDGYLIVWYVGQPWWSNDKILQEDLVLKVAPDTKADFATVVNFLQDMAEQLCCSGIGAGTAFSDRDPALVRVYQKHGFKLEASQLFKEL